MTREEAINKVRHMSLPKETMGILQALVPELTESEDERARKEIIDFIQWAEDRGSVRHDYHQAKRPAVWIGYLERQKECLADNGKTSASEDERIMKWIKKEIEDKYVVEGIVNNKLADEAFGWLEKQKHLYETTKDRFYSEGFEEGQLYERRKKQKPSIFPSGLGEVHWNPISSVQQKPADNVSKEEYVKRFKALCDAYEIKLPNREYDIYHLCDDLSKLSIDSGKHEFAEWDEEDETHGAFILESLEDQIRFCKKDAEGAYRAKQIRTAQNWLKSLPLNLKKKNEDVAKLCSNEWSEEDEHRRKDAIYFLESAMKHYADTSEIEKTIDWLNSLRSQSKKELSMEKAIQWLDDTFYFSDNSSGRGRDCEITTHDFDSLEEMYDSFRKAVTVDSEPHWKPSEEQMEALKEAADYSFYAGEGATLRILYNDLQKRYGTCSC